MTPSPNGPKSGPSSRWAFIPLLLAAFLVAACSGKEAEQPPPSVPVVVAQAVQRDVPVQIGGIGTVEAEFSVIVRSRIDGQIVKVQFREGQDVRKGDLLFVLDPSAIDASLRQAEATLAKDKVQAVNADVVAKRYALLVQKGYVAQNDYDQYRTTADALKATVKADQAAVENLRVQKQYCYIRSPINGRTGRRLVDIGSVVKNNDTAMLVVNQLTPVKVAFSVPEKYLADIRKYRAAGTLKVEALIPEDKRAEAGTIFFVDNAVDTATGTIRLKGTFSNREKRLWPGQFVNAILTLTTQKGAVVIPSAAVNSGQQGAYVYVVKPDRTAEMRAVVVNRSLDGETVIDKGIAPGETVVTDGQIRLVPGSRVEIKQGQ